MHVLQWDYSLIPDSTRDMVKLWETTNEKLYNVVSDPYTYALMSLFWAWQKTYVFQKIQGMSWLDERLLGFQESK
jgi:hypothetical protein